MNDIKETMEILEDFNILQGITKKIENETKKQEGGYLGMLLSTLEASSLGNMLAGKGIVRTDYSHFSSSTLHNNQGQGMIHAGYG